MKTTEQFYQEETFPATRHRQDRSMVAQGKCTLKDVMLHNLEKHLGVVGYAAKATGINRVTHYKWLDSDAEYKNRVEALNELLLDYAESRLLKYIKKEDLRAIMFLLQTKGKQRGYTKYWIKEEDKKMFELVLKLYNEKDADFFELMRLKYSNADQTTISAGTPKRLGTGATGNTATPNSVACVAGNTVPARVADATGDTMPGGGTPHGNEPDTAHNGV